MMMHIISSLRLRLPCKWAAHPAYSYKLHEESRRKKRVMIAGVMSNDDVLFHWNNLAIDIRAIIRGNGDTWACR